MTGMPIGEPAAQHGICGIEYENRIGSKRAVGFDRDTLL
jgi:hypothetical protein